MASVIEQAEVAGSEATGDGQALVTVACELADAPIASPDGAAIGELVRRFLPAYFSATEPGDFSYLLAPGARGPAHRNRSSAAGRWTAAWLDTPRSLFRALTRALVAIASED